MTKNWHPSGLVTWYLGANVQWSNSSKALMLKDSGRILPLRPGSGKTVLEAGGLLGELQARSHETLKCDLITKAADCSQFSQLIFT